MKKASYGFWAAFAGLALQLVGFIWDALLHRSDPTLAARESVFSLTNPGHLLIALGMGLVMAGVAGGCSSSPVAARGLSSFGGWL